MIGCSPKQAEALLRPLVQVGTVVCENGVYRIVDRDTILGLREIDAA